MKRFSIITPIFNRQRFVERLFYNIQSQSFKDFEWIIINDGSTDNTDSYIKKYLNNDYDFSIKYISQTRGGKHKALNAAFEILDSEYWLILDSDDLLIDNVLEIINSELEKVDSSLNGITLLKIFPNGSMLGKTFCNYPYIDSTYVNRGLYGISGDKCDVLKTSLIKKLRYPVFEGEYFINENYMWFYFDQFGKTRYLNVSAQICEFLNDGLTKDQDRYINNPKGFCALVTQINKYCKLGYKVKMRRYIDCVQTLHLRYSIFKISIWLHLFYPYLLLLLILNKFLTK